VSVEQLLQLRLQLVQQVQKRDRTTSGGGQFGSGTSTAISIHGRRIVLLDGDSFWSYLKI
jgi:hypothetical protein